MDWHTFENGNSIGQHGSESGTIVRDEEHKNGARITLERDCHTAPFAITCGIYGWMVHTRFFGFESEAQFAFEDMKEALARILDAILLMTDPALETNSQAVAELIAEFIERFP